MAVTRCARRSMLHAHLKMKTTVLVFMSNFWWNGGILLEIPAHAAHSLFSYIGLSTIHESKSESVLTSNTHTHTVYVCARAVSHLHLCTWTFLDWPKRCARSVACSSTAGFQWRSNMKTWLPPTRFSPSPPAIIDRSITCGRVCMYRF